jgi:O-methyltransferase involved in polyketide biosynthesis
MPAEHSRISPTAHYTSYVWVRNGLSHPALASPLGRRLYRVLWPVMEAYKLASRRPALEEMLLLRHREIDARLERAIVEGRVAQVIEVAAGFSARGLRFKKKFPHLVYLEGDLAPQAAEKRRLLDQAGLREPGHEVLALDALVDHGEESLAAIARARLDANEGCAILTEGLVNYFDTPTVEGLWRRIAGVLGRFPQGLYLSDINLRADARGAYAAEAFKRALELFARGRVHLHYDSVAAAEAALRRAGFSTLTLHWPERQLVRVIDAATAST